MKRFSGCWFGPMEVRRVLRALCEAGERPIGWGAVQQRDGLGGSIAMGLIGFVPGIGPLLAFHAAREHMRFMVLTDRRVVLLRADRRIPEEVSGVEEYTFPVVLLEIGRTVEPHVFELGLRSGVEGRQAGYLGAYEVLQSEIGASARLIAALEMLSGEGDGGGG